MVVFSHFSCKRPVHSTLSMEKSTSQNVSPFIRYTKNVVDSTLMKNVKLNYLNNEVRPEIVVEQLRLD